VAEIDSLAMLMDAVSQGHGATLQPAAAVSRFADAGDLFHLSQITDKQVHRVNILCSLSDEELSPPALAARVVLTDCLRNAVLSGKWRGTQLID
jgi:LysR family tcuABC transcriptional regulator